jgi:hypothetical protein
MKRSDEIAWLAFLIVLGASVSIMLLTAGLAIQ